MSTPFKCAVKDCENHSHQGKFVGLLCSPCHAFVAGDGGLYSQAYRNSRSMIDLAVAMEREAIGQKLDDIEVVAKRLALDLECVLLNPSKWHNEAHESLQQYRNLMDAWYPQEHVSPLGMD